MNNRNKQANSDNKLNLNNASPGTDLPHNPEGDQVNSNLQNEKRGAGRRINTWLLSNAQLISIYVKVIGLLFGVASLIAILLQINAALDQNRQIAGQNASIAKQTEALAKQNELMWYANRPVLRISMAKDLVCGPSMGLSGSTCNGTVRMSITNVGQTPANLHDAVIEKLYSTSLTSDTVNYAGMLIPPSDGFNQDIDVIGDIETTHFFRVTCFFSWEQSLNIRAELNIERVYAVKWESGRWTVKLKSPAEWALNVRRVQAALGR